MTERILKALHSIDLLADLADPLVNQLAKFSMIRSIRTGETIFCQSEPSPYCFGIISGQVTIQSATREQGFSSKIFSILGPGALFGEQALFKDGTRTAAAIASMDGELVAIQGKALRDWLEKDPAIGMPLIMAILENTLSRLRKTDHELYLVYGAGRALAADKPAKECLEQTADFLRLSLAEVEEIVVYRKSPFWDEFEPVAEAPKGKNASILKRENALITQLNQSLRPVVCDLKAYIPFVDPKNTENPLQGFLEVIGKAPQPFKTGVMALLTTMAVQFWEVLQRQQRLEDQEAQSRLMNGRQAYRS